MNNSLMLIQPKSLSLCVQTEGTAFNNPRRRVRADFVYGRTNYRIIVTDPIAERTYLALSDGDYKINEAYLCISLAGVHTDNCCYKLVAAVIIKQ